MENCMPEGQEHIQRIVPSGLPELVFYFDDKPEVNKPNHSFNESTVIGGQLNTYYDLKVSGNISLFSIIFQPHGLSAFLDIPVQELYNQNVPLRFISKDEIHKIETRLFEANSFKERILMIESYFTRQLEKNDLNYNYHRIENSICKINKTKGLLSIDDLANDACYSRKQFERVFSGTTGISPRQFLKVIRFQHAIERKALDASLNLTDITYQCGYYDQAHMVNDFRQLSGMTPGQFFNDCEPYSDYFQ